MVDKNQTSKENESRYERSSCLLPTRKQSNDPKLRNRMKLCALSILIMWASSLKSVVYIVSFAIDVPSILTSYHSCKSAFQVTRDEEKRFSSCVDIQLDQCKSILEAETDRESERANLASLHNSQVLKHVTHYSSNCVADYTELRNSLEAWIALKQSIPTHNTSCSGEEIQELLSTITSIESFKTDAFNVSTRIEANGRGTFNRMIDYTKIRIRYDQDYLQNHSETVQKFFYTEITLPSFNISSKILGVNETIDTMIACLSLRNDSNCPLQHNLLDASFESVHNLSKKFKQESFDAYTEYISTMQDTYNSMYGKVEDFRNGAMTSIEQWKQFYNDATNVVDSFINMMNKWPGKSANAWSRISIGDIIPNDFSLPPLSPPTHLIEAAKDAYNEQIQSQLEIAYDYYTKEISQNFKQINDIYENWTLEVRNVYSIDGLGDIFLPDDYNPPQYSGTSDNIIDITQEEEYFNTMSENFVQDSTSTINNVANATGVSDQIDDVTTTTSAFNLTSFRTKVANFDFNFERLVTPDIDFDLWFLDIVAIGDVMFLADYAIRIFFSVRMCCKYWSVSAVKLPHIDLRTEKELATNPFKWNNGRLFIAMISNPLTGLLLMSIIISWIVTFSTSVYFPILDEYKSGCTAKSGNGTFISENLYPSAYNYAYNGGTSSLIKGMESIEKNRTNTCSSEYTTSAQKYNEDTRKFTGYLQLIMQVQNEMESFGKCIDPNLIDAQFESACCNHSGYVSCQDTIMPNITCPMMIDGTPYPPPGQYLLDESCEVDFQSKDLQLINAIFDCAALTSCEITCKTPHKDKLRTTTKECGCIGEWLFHSYWLRGIMSMVIFLILNMSRITFIDGLARIFWKSLHPGSFTVWTTCDEAGSIIIKPQKDKDSADDLQDNLRSKYQESRKGQKRRISLTSSIVEQLDKNSFKFRISGLVMVLGAFSLNLLWIAILLRTQDHFRLKWL